MFRQATIIAALVLAPAAVAHALDDDAAIETATEPTVTARDARAADPYAPSVIGFPIVGYTPDTSWAFAALGLVQWRNAGCSPESRMSSVAVAASVTLRHQWLVTADPSFVLLDDRLRVGGSFLFDRWESDYFGMGDDARFRDLETYGSRRLRVGGSIDVAVGHPKLFVGLTSYATDVRVHDIEPGGILESDDPIGMRGGTASGLGVALTWDGRDIEFYPTRGTYVRAELREHHRVLGSDFDYVLGSVDTRAYVSLGRRPGHILAGQFTTTANSRGVPLSEIARIGGMNSMRGMTRGRYRDTASWDGQLEYRSPFVWRIGFVAFAGLGDVFHELTGSELDDPKWAAGGGMRLQVDEETGVNVRLDYGVSADEHDGVYLSITEAF